MLLEPGQVSGADLAADHHDPERPAIGLAGAEHPGDRDRHRDGIDEAADRSGRAIVAGRASEHRLGGVGGSCRGLSGLARRGPAGNRDQGDRLGPGQPVRERRLGEVVVIDCH